MAEQIEKYKGFLAEFVSYSRDILKESLVGIYLHGSSVMGCFNEKKSDIDLLVVLNGGIPSLVKRRYMDMVVRMNRRAPAKGIELSLVREDVCRPFVYPTPFELHFSPAHLARYRADPEDYIRSMQGTDKDLAAHFTVVCHRGRALFGKPVGEVFDRVDRAYYFDSIWGDIKDAEKEIAQNPMYFTLNLCRVLAYQEEGLVLSKQEGGAWGLLHVPARYAGLISDAAEEYRGGRPMALDAPFAREYAGYMLARIQNT